MRNNAIRNQARWFAVAGLAGAIAAASGSAAYAQAEEEYEGVVEEVVSLGTRRQPRAAIDTAVAVDVFNSEALESVNSPDMVDVISTLVPSFNVSRQPISDGATFIRPVQLRGLDSHHTLVLVNGKRRHRASLVQLGGFGSHGPDVGSIPTIALKNVEVLRDGAAAQYGSDAIAGVLNFNLKDSNEGGEVRVRYGEYDEGDGESVTLEGNIGLPLGENGFINISGQYGDSEATSRSQPYDIGIQQSGQTPSEARSNSATVGGTQFFGPDAFTNTYSDTGQLLQSVLGSDGIPDDLDTRYDDNFSTIGGSSPFSSPAQIWGQPEQEQILLFVNAALPITDELELYGHGNYSEKEVAGGFFHRRPGVSQLLPVRLADGTIYNPRDDLYPSGFTPQFSSEVFDFGGAVGIRGTLANGMDMDLSASFGENEIQYTLANTMNPSLGPATPTSFRPGDLISDEFSINADFGYGFDVGFASDLYFAFGAEYREENYEVAVGGPQSFAVGDFGRPDPFDLCNDDGTPTAAGVAAAANGLDCANDGDPVYNAKPIGSNGFPGYSPAAASDRGRDSFALYVDAETDVTEEWLVNVAARYEDYSDFGDVAIFKIATRYSISENVNLRGSIGTGFRAPTMGQISTTNISTRIDPNGNPVAEGIFPADSAPAAIFGASPLDSEDSFSYTLGLTATPLDGLSLTVDYYFIELEDRITLSSQFNVGPDEIAALTAAGVTNASDIAQVRFFTNDVDTETSGIDVVGTYAWDWSLGSSSLALAYNYTSTEITEAGRFINAEGEFDNEHGAPEDRANLTFRNSYENFDMMLRGRYFGEYKNTSNATLANTQTFDPNLYVDLELSYNFMDNYRVTLGGQNIFDQFPDKGQFETCCGRIYRSDSIPDWQGQLWYLQASAQF
ncbi:MAG: TonB-dependent receptor [Pseudomonadota bacterium]|nr:TonB-dependent receptor [Pseudomonadota bacterium]